MKLFAQQIIEQQQAKANAPRKQQIKAQALSLKEQCDAYGWTTADRQLYARLIAEFKSL